MIPVHYRREGGITGGAQIDRGERFVLISTENSPKRDEMPIPFRLITASVLLFLVGCVGPRPGSPAPRTGDEIVVCGRMFHTGAPVVPAFISAFTDSRFFRARGIAAYGLSPFAFDGLALRTVHAPDERIPLAVLDRGVATMIRAVRALVLPDSAAP